MGFSGIHMKVNVVGGKKELSNHQDVTYERQEGRHY